MLGVRLGVVGILAREDVKVLTVYVDLSVICVGCVGLEVRANNSGGFGLLHGIWYEFRWFEWQHLPRFQH
jgi:hypothetical protein